MALTLSIIQDGDGLDQLAEVVNNLHPALADVADGLKVPSADVTVILTTDIQTSVRQRSTQADFRVERMGGGRVSGKTLPTTPDYATVNVFIDASKYVVEANGSNIADAAYTLAHEYGHIYHARLRQAAAPEPPAWEPAGMARVFVIEAVEELRCDLLADTMLQAAARVHEDSTEGQERAARAWDLLHDSHTLSLGAVLDEVVHPGWPDLVESYQHGEIDLTSMWTQLATETRQVLNLLAHAQALAISGQREGPLKVYRDHPGVQHYLGPAWEEIASVIDGRAIFPNLDDFAEDQDTVAAAGVKGVLDMWSRLGITSLPMEPPNFELRVASPLR